MTYYCPCCGFSELSGPPYADASKSGLIRGYTAPYSIHFGLPSFEVCSCCGFEFGNDDEPGIAQPVTFEKYLADWIAAGMKWFNDERRPSDWSLEEQLANASKKG